MIYIIKKFDRFQPDLKWNKGYALSKDKAKEMIEILKEENINETKKLDGDNYKETIWEIKEIDGIISYYEVYNPKCKREIFQIKPVIEGEIYDECYKEVD